jgi:hypothetical protein
MAGSVTAPKIEVDVAACEYSEWRRFAPFHYLTAELNKAARTFAAYIDGAPVAFAGLLRRPVSKAQRTGQNLMGISRGVTLPDWQGIGLQFVLIDTVCAAYKAKGLRVNSYPAHPALIRSCDKSPNWSMIKRPGFAISQRGGTDKARRDGGWSQGVRPCATFSYIGPALPVDQATTLLRPYLKE